MCLLVCMHECMSLCVAVQVAKASMEKVQGETECFICKTLVGVAQNLLKENATEVSMLMQY